MSSAASRSLKGIPRMSFRTPGGIQGSAQMYGVTALPFNGYSQKHHPLFDCSGGGLHDPRVNMAVNKRSIVVHKIHVSVPILVEQITPFTIVHKGWVRKIIRYTPGIPLPVTTFGRLQYVFWIQLFDVCTLLRYVEPPGAIHIYSLSDPTNRGTTNN
jgi:hypothetical protein